MTQQVIEIRARGLRADVVDRLRCVAREHGYRHTNSDVVRFALWLAYHVSSAPPRMTIHELLEQFPGKTEPLRRVGGAYRMP